MGILIQLNSASTVTMDVTTPVHDFCDHTLSRSDSRLLSKHYKHMWHGIESVQSITDHLCQVYRSDIRINIISVRCISYCILRILAVCMPRLHPQHSRDHHTLCPTACLSRPPHVLGTVMTCSLTA